MRIMLQYFIFNQIILYWIKTFYQITIQHYIISNNRHVLYLFTKYNPTWNNAVLNTINYILLGKPEIMFDDIVIKYLLLSANAYYISLCIYKISNYATWNEMKMISWYYMIFIDIKWYYIVLHYSTMILNNITFNHLKSYYIAWNCFKNEIYYMKLLHNILSPLPWN